MRKPTAKSRHFKLPKDRPELEGRGYGVMPARPAKVPPPAPTIPPPSVARGHMLYGVHPVTAAWLNPDRSCRHLYATAQALTAFAPTVQQAAALKLKRPAPIVVERDGIDRLLPAGAVHQGLALDAEPLPEVNLDDVLIAAGNGPVALVMLDQVTDPHNVGAILRSAAAFGAKGMIVQSRHAPEVTGVLAKAASGAVEVVPILRETNLARAIERMRDAGVFVIGLDEAGSCTLDQANFGTRAALVLGAEGDGLRRLVAEGCDLLASLPTVPPIGSLNVSNAAAIGLYEIACRANG